MNLKPVMCKAVELGIGLTAISTLILAGCGGSSSSVSRNLTPAFATTTLNVSPALGKFMEGATVRIKNQSGVQVGSGTVNASGVAAVAVPSDTQGTLLIEAGLTGDQYYDEKQGKYATVSGVNGAAVRALVPDLATASQVGVTALTEIAVGSLADAFGVLSANISPASAVGANTAVANSFGVADVLKPPKLVGSASDVAALGSLADDEKYAAKLAGLAHMAKPGEDAMKVAHRLRESMKGANPASSVNVVVTELNNALGAASGVPAAVKSGAYIGIPVGALVKLTDLIVNAASNAQQAQTLLTQQLGATKPTPAQVVQAYNTAMQHFASAVQDALTKGGSITIAANTAASNANAALVVLFPRSNGDGAKTGGTTTGGVASGVTGGVTGSTTTYTLTVTGTANGIAIPPTTFKNMLKPVDQAAFCSNPTVTNVLNVAANGTLTINSCTFNGASGAISATLKVASGVSLTVPYVFNYSYQ